MKNEPNEGEEYTEEQKKVMLAYKLPKLQNPTPFVGEDSADEDDTDDMQPKGYIFSSSENLEIHLCILYKIFPYLNKTEIIANLPAYI